MAFTGYSINGIALHDQQRGWRILRAGTSTQGGVTKQVQKVAAPGRPGYSPAPSTYTEQAMIFIVRTTRAGLESLLVLAESARVLTRTDDPTKEAYVELASAIPGGENPLDAWFEVTITLIAYEGVWRDTAFSAAADGSTAVAITTPVQQLYLLPGIGAGVFDQQILISGVFGQFTLTDSHGSFLKTTRAWPGTSTNGLLYNGATGQAFLTNSSSPWVPVSDASQYIDVSGNGGFSLTPELVSGNPADRRVHLTLTTLSQTSVNFRIKAKRAYRMN